MKRNVIQPLFIIVALGFSVLAAYAQTSQKLKSDITIFFSDSAARYVLQNPERALQKERDSIWRSFEGYRITLVWHEKSSVPVTWKVWERGLDKFLYKDTSLVGKSLTLVDSLQSKVRREQDKIAHHISKYLGQQTKCSAHIYFVAFTYPYAFCVEGNKIGIDITGDEWNFDVDCILNMTIHEIYHVGFKVNSPDYDKYVATDPTNSESFIRFHHAFLQSEGMATLVAYRALDLYPTQFKHNDYKLLEDENEVKEAIRRVNSLGKMAKNVPMDSLMKEVWHTGVEERAYYVTGAYMAKTIEEKSGPRFLSELVNKGSLSFVGEYNMLVPDGYRVRLYEF